MPSVSLEEFIATLRVIPNPACPSEKLFTYWNNRSVTDDDYGIHEVLRISRREDGSFYLEIANLLHEGTLVKLEKSLYEWAASEGWLI